MIELTLCLIAFVIYRSSIRVSNALMGKETKPLIKSKAYIIKNKDSIDELLNEH